MKLRMPRAGWLAAAFYVVTIVAVNYSIRHVGTVPFPGGPHTLPVGFGLSAPSGVYLVAVALVLRNVVQRQLGIVIALAAILVGSLLSWWTADGTLALASGVAVLCSELLDTSIYTPLRSRFGQVRAVLPASLAGGLLDSAVFLAIAFHSEAFWQAQVVGKTWGVLAATAVLALIPYVSIRAASVEAVPA